MCEKCSVPTYCGVCRATPFWLLIGVAFVGCVFAPIRTGSAAQNRSDVAPLESGEKPQSSSHEASAPDSTCGPRSLWVAAARSGVPIDLEALIKACDVTPRGTTMLDLKQVAEAFGLRARGVRLTWNKLQDMQTPVVLYVRTGHFFCVDPREKGEGPNAGKVRVYDPPKTAVWMSHEELARIWEGEALVVWPAERPGVVEGAKARFDTLLVDFGTLDADTGVTTYSFAFTNVGTRPLKITEMLKSCGCTSVAVTRKTIPPGENAAVVMTLDLHGRHGPQSHMARMASNDPLTSSSMLLLQGVARRPVRLSRQLIDFGDVLPGHSVRREITLTDRGNRTLEIRRAGVSFNSVRSTTGENNTVVRPLSESERPTVSIRWQRTEPGTGEAQNQALAADPDSGTQPSGALIYRLTLEATVPPAAPQAAFDGNLAVVIANPKKHRVQVPVRLEVVGDYYVSPSKIYFGVLRPGQNTTRRVTLRRRSGAPVRLIDCRTGQKEVRTEGVSPETRIIEEAGEKAIVELSMSLPEKPSPTELSILKGEIVLQPAAAPGLGVKWLCIPKY